MGSSWYIGFENLIYWFSFAKFMIRGLIRYYVWVVCGCKLTKSFKENIVLHRNLVVLKFNINAGVVYSYISNQINHKLLSKI